MPLVPNATVYNVMMGLFNCTERTILPLSLTIIILASNNNCTPRMGQVHLALHDRVLLTTSICIFEKESQVWMRAMRVIADKT